MKRLLSAVGALVICCSGAQAPAAGQSLKNGIGMEFVTIPAGEFMMGCSPRDNACKNDERPAHRVRITKSFEMGRFEVTQAQWKAVMGTDPSGAKGADRPVENVTRVEAQTFLDRLNARNDGYRYRLPTEAEWEYAARAGTTGPYYGNLDEIAWYAGNSEDETHPVGMKKPNVWGLYDMIGNVREWVSDTYSANYYRQSPSDDPQGPAAAGAAQPAQPGARGGTGAGTRGGRGGPGGGRGAPTGRGGRARNDDAAAGFVAVAQQRGGGPRGGRGAAPAPAPQTAGRGAAGGGNGRGGGGGGLPIMRGGAWDNPEAFVRVTDRFHYYGPTLRISDLGFRAVRQTATPVN